MRTKTFLLLPLLVFFSCQEETEDFVEESEHSDEIEAEADVPLEDGVEMAEGAEEAAVDNRDSLKALVEELEQRKQDMYFQLEDAKSKLYSFTHSTFGVYDGSTSIWYFDNDFQPLFYYRDMAAEGGYMEEDLWVFKDGEVNFAYSMINDVGVITKTYHLIEDYEGKEKLVGIKKDEFSENKETSYSVPDPIKYDLMYQELLETHTANQFKPGTTFEFEDSKEVNSPYGGTEFDGYNIKIDRSLFEHFYGKVSIGATIDSTMVPAVE